MNICTNRVIGAIVFLGILSLALVAAVPAQLNAGPGHSGGHEHQEETASRQKTDSAEHGEDAHAHDREQPDHRTGGDSLAAGHDTAEKGHHGKEDASGESVWTTLLPGLAGAPNIHPMLVHFPIAFIVAATLFVGLSWFTYPEHFLMIGRWMFWLGLISLPVVAASGFWAIGGWGEGHVTTHRNLMLLTTATAYLVFGLGRWVSHRKWLYRMVLTVGLIVVTVFMTLGADRGAYLVFVEGAGVQSIQTQHQH